MVRVGIVEETQACLFSTNGPIKVRDTENRFIRILPEGEWEARIKNGAPASRIFRCQVLRTSDLEKANQKYAQLYQQGMSVVIETEGRLIESNGRTISDNRVFLVFTDQKFSTKTEAEKYRSSLKDVGTVQIVEGWDGNPGGTLLLTNLQDSTVQEFHHSLRLEGNTITIRNVDSGQGFHWQSKENRSYTGTLEFRRDNSGKLTIINELDLEQYLKGVVPSEMPDSFPMQALKAQAVAVRSVVLRKMGLAHLGKAFDICDDVHCQVYAGIKEENKNVERAIFETEGMVLMHGEKIAEAVYAALCGGHTEAAHNIWSGSETVYLSGVLDQTLKKYETLGDFLKSEKNIRTWIENEPKTYCNHLNSSQKRLAEGAAKYFRWEVTYSPEELGNIIAQKTGEKVGIIKTIRPLARGVSGRILSLEIQGSLKTIKIEKELTIRQALSSTTLYSSCFIVDKLSDGKFKMKGAGLGHGVGMCQYGAAGMALAGKDFLDILSHYYPGTEVVRFYAL